MSTAQVQSVSEDKRPCVDGATTYLVREKRSSSLASLLVGSKIFGSLNSQKNSLALCAKVAQERGLLGVYVVKSMGGGGEGVEERWGLAPWERTYAQLTSGPRLPPVSVTCHPIHSFIYSIPLSGLKVPPCLQGVTRHHIQWGVGGEPHRSSRRSPMIIHYLRECSAVSTHLDGRSGPDARRRAREWIVCILKTKTLRYTRHRTVYN